MGFLADVCVVSCDFDGVLNNKSVKKVVTMRASEARESAGSDYFRHKLAVMKNPLSCATNMAELMMSMHATLLEQLRGEFNASGADILELLNGSSRQSTEIDEQNEGFLRISVFSMLPYFANALGANLNTALLPDATNPNVDEGETWRRRCMPGVEQLTCPFEKNKILLLYYQMHTLALKYPNKKISFNFMDDNTGILTSILSYFTKNPTLVPNNIALKLWHYQESDDRLIQYGQINGQGEACANYKEKINNFISWAMKSRKNGRSETISVDHVTAQMLETPGPSIDAIQAEEEARTCIELEPLSPTLFSPLIPKRRKVAQPGENQSSTGTVPVAQFS